MCLSFVSLGKMYVGRLIFLLALWAFSSNIFCAATEQVYDSGVSSPNLCSNCTICQYPCHRRPPPPPSGYQSYPAAPPPAAGNCMTPAVTCCQYSPPAPYTPLPYGAYDNYSAAALPPSTPWCYGIYLLLLFLCG